MKFRLLPFIAVCAALSCTRESVERPDDGPVGNISFSTRLDGLTRGEVLMDAEGLAEAGGFEVWAISHSTAWGTSPSKAPLLDGQPVAGSVSGGAVLWDYGTAAKWPESSYVSFFAYGPSHSATVGAPNANGVPTLSFEVATDVKQQEELMIATPVYDQTGSDYPSGQPVNLMFGHALSRIALSGVKVDADGQSVKVRSVKFNGLYSAGTVGLGDAVPQWNVDETSTASYLLSVEGGELADVQLLSTSTELTTEVGYMFLMPQSLARSSGQEVVMEVTLDMNGTEETQTMPVFHPAEWVAGRSYEYELVVEGNEVELVLVATEDLTLTDWDVNVMIQAVPLGSDPVIDSNRLVSAIDGFGYLNMDDEVPSADPCKFFAIYLMNDILHNITIDMERFEGMFTSGENVIFDGKKVVNSWPGC